MSTIMFVVRSTIYTTYNLWISWLLDFVTDSAKFFWPREFINIFTDRLFWPKV